MPAAVSPRAVGASKVAVHLLPGSARCRSGLGESDEERASRSVALASMKRIREEAFQE
jgi:hypothetical protein